MHIQTEHERTLEFMKNNPSCVNVIDEEHKASIDNIPTPYNKEALETGVTDINEAARNLYECAIYTYATENLTLKNFYDAIGSLVAIASEYYVKKPQDAPTSNVDEKHMWREDEYRRLHPEEFSDSVDHPAHYETDGQQVIEIIESIIDGIESKQAFFLGNILKYAIRAGKKGDIHEDLAKANNYAHRLCSGHWRWEGGQNE